MIRSRANTCSKRFHIPLVPVRGFLRTKRNSSFRLVRAFPPAARLRLSLAWLVLMGLSFLIPYLIIEYGWRIS